MIPTRIGRSVVDDACSLWALAGPEVTLSVIGAIIPCPFVPRHPPM